MSIINLKATSFCASGGHATIQAALNGTPRATSILDEESFSALITQEEIDATVKVLVRIIKMGRTFAETKTLLSAPAGVDIVVP